MCISDWRSDVCSSDLDDPFAADRERRAAFGKDFQPFAEDQLFEGVMRAKSICARLLPSRSRAHVAPDQGYEPLPAHRIRIGVKGAIVAGTSLRRQGPCCTQQCASNGRSFTPRIKSGANPVDSIRSEEHTSEL